jgi:hypothetical protein
VHAGADPDRLLAGSDLPVPAPVGPVLRVSAGTEPTEGAAVARFGALTVTDPGAVEPTEAQLDTRRQLGAALVANPTSSFPAADAALLTEGRVDPRLLTLLAGIGARNSGVGVAALPPVPGEPDDAPVRRAVITTLGGTALADDPAATERFRGWLGAQKEPYVPDTVSEVPEGLLIGYDLVRDPDALVTAPRR